MSEEFEKAVMKRFDDMDKKMDNINTELNEKMDNMNAELNQNIDSVNKELTERIDSLSESVAVLEYKVTTEFPAIYEAHTLNYEIQKLNEKKLDSLLETTSKHSIHITHLYETVRNQNDKIRKLIS